MMTVAECEAAKQGRVLIVSSDAAFRIKWSGLPLYDGKAIEEAAGGADALAKLESASWGEVFLDRKLHDLDVNEVLRTIQSRHPHLSVRLVDSQQELEPAVEGLTDLTGKAVEPRPDASVTEERSFELPLLEEMVEAGPDY